MWDAKKLSTRGRLWAFKVVVSIFVNFILLEEIIIFDAKTNLLKVNLGY